MDPYGMYGSSYPEHIIYYPPKQTSPAFQANARGSSGYPPQPAHANISTGYPPTTVPTHRNTSVYLPPAPAGDGYGDVERSGPSLDFSTESPHGGPDYYNYQDYQFNQPRFRSPQSQMIYTGEPMRYNELMPSPTSFPPPFEHGGRGFRGRSGMDFSRGRGGRGSRPYGRGKPRRLGLTSPESGGAGLGTPRQSQTFFCSVCNVTCAGHKAYADHQAGQRHTKRAAQLSAIEKLEKTGQTTVKTSTISKARELYCELCKIGCYGAEAYTAHLNGKPHKRVVRQQDQLNNKSAPVVAQTTPTPAAVGTTVSLSQPTFAAAKPSTPKPSPSATKPSNGSVEKPKAHKQSPISEEKLLGEEYVEPVPGLGGKGVQYQCKLCECQFTNLEAKYVHLRGRRHRLQYKKKVDPSLIIEPKSGNLAYKKATSRVGAGIPQIPRPDPIPRSVLYTLMDDQNAFGPVPRFVYRKHGPVTFTSMPPYHHQIFLENRHVIVKHSTLVPTDIEVQAMRSAVGICEHALKNISDILVESRYTSLTTSSTTETSEDSVVVVVADDDDGDGEEAKTDDADSRDVIPSGAAAAAATNRLFCGVVRVGALGKSLLLRGDHLAELVLVCSEWPTTGVVRYLKTELTKGLGAIEPTFAYDVKAELSNGLITIRVEKPKKQSNGTEQQQEQKEEADDWPAITIQLNITAYAVRKAADHGNPTQASAVSVAALDVVESGAVKSDEHVNAAASASTPKTCNSNTTSALQRPTDPVVEQPKTSTKKMGRSVGVHKLFAQGVRVVPTPCLQSLEAIDQAKWFQTALTKPPLGMVSRVLVDFMRANEDWQELDQFALLAFLDHLLTFDLRTTGPAPNAGPRPPLMGFLPPPPPQFAPGPTHGGSRPQPIIGPGRLLRQFFEAIASGLLLRLSTESPPHEESSTNKPPLFFAFSMLATTPIEMREVITVSAQYCLRLMAFRQLHKVLRMEAIKHTFTPRSRRMNDGQQVPDKDEAVITDIFYPDNFTTADDHVIDGTSKRRRIDDELVPPISGTVVEQQSSPLETPAAGEQILVDEEPAEMAATTTTTPDTAAQSPQVSTRSTRSKRTRNV